MIAVEIDIRLSISPAVTLRYIHLLWLAQQILSCTQDTPLKLYSLTVSEEKKRYDGRITRSIQALPRLGEEEDRSSRAKTCRTKLQHGYD